MSFTAPVVARGRRRIRTALLLVGALIVGLVVSVTPAPAHAAPGVACVAAGSGASTLRASGIFIQPDGMTNSSSAPLTEAQWVESLQSYKAAGMTNVIVQYVAKTIEEEDGTRWRAFYPNADAGGAIYTPGTDGSTDPKYTDTLVRILAAAKESGMTVTIGLGLAEQEWFSSSEDTGWTSASWLQEQAQLALRAASSIWDTYGEEYGDAIDGWYLPYENEGYQLANGTTAAPEKLDPYITSYAGPVSAGLVALSGKTKVMVSPLFTARTNDPDSDVEKARLSAWTTAWAKVFRETKVSVLAPQDGAGSGKNTLLDITRWFTATTAAKTTSGNPDVQVWGNAEIYRDQNHSVANLGINQISQDLSAMRAGGATGMVMFSALSLEYLPGHGFPATVARKRPFYDAYARWANGGCATTAKLSSPSAVSAVTGSSGADADPFAAVNASTTVRLTWDASTTTAPADRWDLQVAGYQVVRDGRVVAEYGPAAPTIALEHVDHQLQPGRTYTYQVYAFDAWGTFSLKPATVHVTIPWTSAALASRDGDAGTFNIARNAPTAVTNNPDGVSISTAGLSAVAPGSALIPSATYGDEVTDPGTIGTTGSTQDFAIGPATDGFLGTDSALDGRWQGQYSSTTHNWGITLRLADPTGPGVTLRQLNTQWLRDKTQAVYLPQLVTATAIRTDGTPIPFGTRSSQDVTGAAPGEATGQFWFNLTAPAELTDITTIEFTIRSGVPGWLFLGQIQAFDSAGTNTALNKPYALTRYNTLDYTDGTTSFPGSRAWSLTDGITAPSKGHTDPAWAGRWMGSKTYAPSNGTNAYITLDLGATQNLTTLTLGTYRDTTAAIHTPTSYRTRTANNDGTWGPWTALTPLTTPPNTTRTALTLTPATPTARFIQIHLTTTPGTLLFLDELEAHTTHTTNAAHNKPVTNLTPCTTGCNTTARDHTTLQTLTAGTSFTTEWNVPHSPWATTNTDNGDLDDGWQFSGVTYEVDLGDPTPLTEITATWLEDYNSSLMLPSQVLFQYQTPTGTWTTFGTTAGHVSLPQEIPRTPLTWTYRTTTPTPITTTHIRIQARNGSLKPDGTKTATAAIAEITARTAAP